MLGHSFGAFVALQHAVDFPGRPAGTIVSSGVPSERFLDHVERELQRFEPVELRERVTASWAREAAARTPEAGVPGAELVVFERSGHMTFVEEPDAYRAALRRFLAAL